MIPKWLVEIDWQGAPWPLVQIVEAKLPGEAIRLVLEDVELPNGGVRLAARPVVSS